ncbi:AraC family transcriptional regulator [Amycolatopsis sp. FDAARGOS 1241]|nr:AraC family transcriptional regulator [Amycolatopsis sp. FDAARGOS 1241]
MMRIETEALGSFARMITGRDDLPFRFDPMVADSNAVAGLHGVAHLIRSTTAQFSGASVWPGAIRTRVREQAMLTLLLSQPDFRLQVTGAPGSPWLERPCGRPLSWSSPARRAVLLSRAWRLPSASAYVPFSWVFARKSTRPGAYILSVRLRRVREELSAARPGEGSTVANIAHRCGFLNLGRFAAQYRRAHGECPSDTLHRR